MRQLFLAVFLLITLLSQSISSVESSSNWEATGWKYRRPITIDNTSIAETHTNIPIMWYATSGNMNFSKAKSDGSDILFFDGNYNKLYYESVTWDSSAQTGIFYFRENSIPASSSTTAWVYYGNPSATWDTTYASSPAVWSNQYTGVWHLEQATGPYLDSSVYNNPLTVTGSPTSTTGYIGKGLYFNNGANYLTAIGAQYATNRWTVEHILNIPDNGDSPIISLTDGGTSFIELSTDSGGLPRIYLRAIGGVGAGFTTYFPPVNTFAKSDMTYDSATVRYYNNSGTLESSLASTFNNPTTLYVGYQSLYGYLYGIIDEVRISNVTRTDNWIKAQTLSDTNTYAVTGSEQTTLRRRNYIF